MLSDSHGTSATGAQSVNPGSTSDRAIGGANSPAGLPPIRYRPQALPARKTASFAFGRAAQESVAGSYAKPWLVIASPFSRAPPETSSRPFAAACAEPHRPVGIEARGVHAFVPGS